jgi:hypothetical protein
LATVFLLIACGFAAEAGFATGFAGTVASGLATGAVPAGFVVAGAELVVPEVVVAAAGSGSKTVDIGQVGLGTGFDGAEAIHASRTSIFPNMRL